MIPNHDTSNSNSSRNSYVQLEGGHGQFQVQVQGAQRNTPFPCQCANWVEIFWARRSSIVSVQPGVERVRPPDTTTGNLKW
eukprot:1981054-Rhodomonas_salina.2